MAKYSAVTPNRPEATCLILDRKVSPFFNWTSLITTSPNNFFVLVSDDTGLNRPGSSPPSPVFDFPPIRFIAIASVECASVDIEPSDIAPVANRVTIAVQGSTWSMGIALDKGVI